MFNLVPATWSHPMTKRGALPLSPALNKRESGNILCVEHSRQYFVRKRNLTIFWHLTTRVSNIPPAYSRVNDVSFLFTRSVKVSLSQFEQSL